VVVAERLTTGVAPPGTGVPSQLPVNQSTVTPAGTAAERVEDWPSHTGLGVAVGSTGASGAVSTITITLAQVVLTQSVMVFRARAKYVVVEAGQTEGLAPPGTGVPPQLSLNHSTVTPVGTDAESVEHWP